MQKQIRSTYMYVGSAGNAGNAGAIFSATYTDVGSAGNAGAIFSATYV